jgi:hypothetical protein
MIVFLAVWTIGLSLMWVRAHHTMQKRGRETVAGEYKAIIELADAMQERLARFEEKSDFFMTLEESSLRRCINKDMHAGLIAYTTPLLANRENGNGGSEWGLWDSLKREGWWIFFHGVCCYQHSTWVLVFRCLAFHLVRWHCVGH